MQALKLVCKTLLLASLIAPAFAGANLVEYPLKDLRNSKAQASVALTEQVASIAMIFQPNCPWCKKQGKTMAKLQQRCGHQLNISVVGIKGNYHQLKRELKHFDPQLTALEADHQFLRLAGGIKAAPTTLFFDKAGQLLLKKRGYIQESSLIAAAEAVSGATCSS